MTIEKATTKDAKDICSVTKTAFLRYKSESGGNISVAALEETLDDIIFDIKKNTVFVAKNGDKKIVGTIRYKIQENGTAYIYRFAVCPQTGDDSAGSCLLDAVFSDCKKNSIEKITLHSNTSLVALKDYYLRYGFKVLEVDTSQGYSRGLFVKGLSQ